MKKYALLLIVIVNTNCSQAVECKPKGNYITGYWNGFTEELVGQNNMKSLVSLSFLLDNLPCVYPALEEAYIHEKKELVMKPLMASFFLEEYEGPRTHTLNYKYVPLGPSQILPFDDNEKRTNARWCIMHLPEFSDFTINKNISKAYTKPSRVATFGIPAAIAGLCAGGTYLGMVNVLNVLGDSWVSKSVSIFLAGAVGCYEYKKARNQLKKTQKEFLDKNIVASCDEKAFQIKRDKLVSEKLNSKDERVPSLVYLCYKQLNLSGNEFLPNHIRTSSPWDRYKNINSDALA